MWYIGGTALSSLLKTLPSLLTVSNLVLGLLALFESFTHHTSQAALLVLVGMVVRRSGWASGTRAARRKCLWQGAGFTVRHRDLWCSASGDHVRRHPAPFGLDGSVCRLVLSRVRRTSACPFQRTKENEQLFCRPANHGSRRHSGYDGALLQFTDTIDGHPANRHDLSRRC